MKTLNRLCTDAYSLYSLLLHYYCTCVQNAERANAEEDGDEDDNEEDEEDEEEGEESDEEGYKSMFTYTRVFSR